MVIVVIFYFIHHGITSIWHKQCFELYQLPLFSCFLFGLFIYRVERKEFDNLLKFDQKNLDIPMSMITFNYD